MTLTALKHMEQIRVLVLLAFSMACLSTDCTVSADSLFSLADQASGRVSMYLGHKLYCPRPDRCNICRRVPFVSVLPIVSPFTEYKPDRSLKTISRGLVYWRGNADAQTHTRISSGVPTLVKLLKWKIVKKAFWTVKCGRLTRVVALLRWSPNGISLHLKICQKI